MPDRVIEQDLIDNPNETLAVEYKSWLDLTDNAVRADLARHIAALANHGGGSIVFGFTDELKFAGPSPYSVPINRDTVAAIIKRYLEPTFQCDILTITSNAGNEHSVVLVPPHGAVPVCVKAGGPVVDGKSRGVTQGAYYTRKPGPESAPILTASEWAPIIRRCAMRERAAIIAAIEGVLRPQPYQPSSEAALKSWHEAANAAFLKYAGEAGWPAEIQQRHWQYSYLIERSGGQRLDLDELAEVLRQVNAEVRDLVATGWSMFYVFNRKEIAPRFQVIAASEGSDEEEEILECALVADRESTTKGAADLWRVAPDGRATIIREYWEDAPDWNRKLNRNPGSWMSPDLLARSLAEMVRHARGLAERFSAPTSVSFRCEWYGIGERVAFDTETDWDDTTPGGVGDRRVASGTWPVASLTDDWATVVVALAGPIARTLGVSRAMTRDWILRQVPRWTR